MLQVRLLYRRTYSREIPLAIALAFIWGTTFPIVRLAGDVENVMFWRYVVSVVFLSIIFILYGGSRHSSKFYLYAAASGVFNFLFLYMMYSSLQLVPSNTVATIVYTYPLINVVLGVALGIEKRSVKGFIGVALGFAGVALIYGLNGGYLNAMGVAQAMLASVFFSLSTIFYGVVKGDIYGFTLIQTFVGFILISMIYSPEDISSLNVFIAIIHQGFGAGSIAYLIWFTLVKRSIQLASSLVYLVPAIAYISALPILGEIPTPSSLAGLALVLLGIYIARRGRYHG